MITYWQLAKITQTIVNKKPCTKLPIYSDECAVKTALETVLIESVIVALYSKNLIISMIEYYANINIVSVVAAIVLIMCLLLVLKKWK